MTRRDEGHGDSAVVLHSPVNVAVLRQPSTTAPETNVTCTTVIIRPRSDAASVVQCRELVLASAVAKLPQPSTIAAETNETCTTVIIHPRTAVECRQLVLASAVAKLPQPSTTAAETKVTCTKVIIRPRRAVAPFIGPHHQLVASASFTAAQDEASDVAASISRAEFETPEPVANLPQPSTTAARINVTCTAVVLRLRSAAAPFDESRHSVVASASAPSTTEEEVSGSATVFKPDIDVASISSDSASHARDTPLPQLVEMTVPSLASTTLSAALETPVKMNTRVLGVSQVVKPDTEVTSQVSVLIASVPTTTAIALPPKQIVSAEASGDYSALVGPQSRSDSCGETIIVLNAHIDVPNVNLLPTEANVCTPSATNISTPEDVPVEDTACSDVIAESYEVNEVNEVNIVQSSSTSSPLRDTASRSSTSIALEAVAQVIEPALPTLTASETLDQPGRHDIGAAGSIDQHDAAIEAQQTDTSAIESTSTMTQPLASDPVTTARNEAQGVAANPSRAEPATRQHVTKSTQHSTTAVNTAVIRTSVANGPRKASPSSRSGTRLVASALASLKTNQEAAGSATLVGDTAKVDSPLTTHVRYTQLPQLVEVNAPSPASATSDAVLEAFKTNAKAKSGSKVVKRDTKVASPNATPTSSAPSAAPSALPSKPIVSAGKHADIDQPQKALRSMASETSPKAATTPAPSGSDNPIRQMNGTTHNGFHLAVLATFASIASASTSAQSPRAANHGESVAPLAKNQAGRLVSALLSKPDDQQAKGKGVDIPDPAPPAAQDPNVASTPVNTTARQVVPIDTKAKSTEAVVRDSQGVPEAQLPVQKEGPIYGEDPYAIQKSEVEAAKEGAAPAEGEPERERPKRGCRAGKRVQKARANQAQRELEAGNNVNGALES
ncbi:hypothetical protein QFC22_002046 [Naganishia vaughanmartiniae]|uniref:Uncharacterized protein n=1 Tax=Naganishia vaughanmartiniae TaxID=1424756 RepID=A0ACC2XFC7_9TREE|nr:hypothetical protein QFC22_002046 [Naganishia vaughanmartiniae]